MKILIWSKTTVSCSNSAFYCINVNKIDGFSPAHQSSPANSICCSYWGYWIYNRDCINNKEQRQSSIDIAIYPGPVDYFWAVAEIVVLIRYLNIGLSALLRLQRRRMIDSVLRYSPPVLPSVYIVR